MKPLLLTMTAFGPFHEMARVDFRKLGENPFFIISGPTGAGKTTILDGICFALYGTSSGGERKDDDLRSRSADRKTETKVTLLFEVAGKRYLIERWPRQEVPKKRGNTEETTTRQHKVVFAQVGANGLQIEGTVIDDVRPIEQKVEAILGLTAAQFRQVVLLPQGEFREFLLSDTKARAEILKKLFKSDRFEAIEGELKARRSAIEKELDGIRSENQGRYSAAEVEGPDQLDDMIWEMEGALEGLLASEGAAGNALSHAENALDEGRRAEDLFARKDAAIAESAKIEAGRPANDAKRKKADRAEKALRLEPAARWVDELMEDVTGKGNAAKELENCQAELKRGVSVANEALGTARKRKEKECPALDAEKHTLEAALPKFAERAAAAFAAAQAKADASKADADVTRLKSEVDRANERLTKLNQGIPLLTKEVAGKGALEERLMAANAREEETAGIVSLEGKLPGAKKRVAEAEKAFEAATKACKDAKKKSEDLQAKAIKGQAIVLAKSLEDGAPCPVCGSTEHPKKAKGKAGEVPDESELNGALEAVSGAEETLEVARKEKTEAEKDLRGIESRIAQAKDTLGKKAARSKGPADDPASLEVGIAALEAKARELSKFEMEKSSIEHSFPENRKALESAQSAMISASTAAEGHEARLDELNKHVPVEYVDAKAAQGRIDKIAIKIKKLEDDVEKFRKEVEEGEKALAANVARHGEVTKACKEAEEKLAGAKKKFERDLLAEGFVDEALFRESLLPKEEIESLRNEVRAFDDGAASAKSALDETGRACEGLTRPALAVLESAKSEAELAKNGALEARVKAEERKGVLEETKRQIGDALGRQKTLESKLAVVGRLANLASGENAKKVGLHTYYLAALFDEVARSASHRLDRMSRARYRLRRTDEVGDARGKAGLDLVVSDSWSGAERPVRTLSGGESFLASLSLALGLSDSVLAQSGGRSLDSLFVDEGFGSLDAESLDMALRTLQELQCAGTSSGRAVGIISHIDEVKKAVGKRIEVTRNPGEATSTIQIKI